MSDAKRVLVFGATGLLGQPVTRHLVAEGFDVRALVREPARARSVPPRACWLVPGDLHDRSSIEQAVADADAVYLSLSNRMTKSRPSWDADTEGTLLASGTFPVKRVQ